ncbi:MAG: ABC transporter ATP-binding protein [Candidatus Poribacteria bacterium]|nr:ABC transporter ATP-binding protein [Candidatus Poribacteria bacterium]MDE0323647.1 ABC transporter ATP-binding protein [Candidatus Poribacteria bacterium]
MISIKNVTKNFGGKNVLNGLSLEISRGETLVVMGQSGCGKSVLLKIITGLISADSGEIWFDGTEISKLKTKKMNILRRKIGMLFQSAALFDSMSVAENIAFMLDQHTDLSKQEMRKIVDEKLSLVDLEGVQDLRPAELSGGMRKRVGLARALAFEPEVIFYDEPTTGLDPVTCTEINQLIRDLHERLRVTSVVVTHDMHSAFSVATRMAMIHEGEKIADGRPDEIINIDNPILQQFILFGAPDQILNMENPILKTYLGR